ncbi:hypothetical protein EJ110_NYTH56580 [Nymphaea thermarum]|nr:hypothetical protein EJ110_NYTH56580 [Nymphaea thermarum]
MKEADLGYNEPLEDEEEAYEYDDEDNSSLRTDLESSRGRDRRGKRIMYEGGRSRITGRKRRDTLDIRARRGMQPPSGRVPTVVDIVFNNEFWESCVKLLKVCVPLVKVLSLADSEDRPSMGYLYEAMIKQKRPFETT